MSSGGKGSTSKTTTTYPDGSTSTAYTTKSGATITYTPPKK